MNKLLVYTLVDERKLVLNKGQENCKKWILCILLWCNKYGIEVLFAKNTMSSFYVTQLGDTSNDIEAMGHGGVVILGDAGIECCWDWACWSEVFIQAFGQYWNFAL